MKTIICYGDSNTYGTMPIDIDILEKAFIATRYRFPREIRWTGVLQRELGQEYEVIEEGLNSRTTVWDDPTEGIHKNGLKYLLPCLESHAPVDLVILMLGSNDLKAKFSLSAYDIAAGIGVLVNTIQKSGCGQEGKAPEVLILSPAHIGKLTNFADLFGKRSVEESKKLADNYRKIAKLYNCKFMDASRHIEPSDIDGAHFNAEDLENFGKEIAKVVKQII
jgi:lysophospholipase L1-like esterase